MCGFNLLAGNSYPALRIYYDVLLDIFQIIKNLQLVFTINFVKVPSHTEIKNNDEADERAKAAANEAINMQNNNDNEWKPELTPAIVDIQRYTSSIREYYQNQTQIEFDKLYNKHFNTNAPNGHNFKDYFMLQSMYYENGSFRTNIGKIWQHEMYKLSSKNSIIIHKLRTEHIELNGYLHALKSHPSDQCKECKIMETVSHFVMNCPKYNTIRDELRLALIRIDERFNEEYFFNIENLLFPHLWVELPKPDDEEYKSLWNEATIKRVSVLNLVCKYVYNSKRFNDDITI